MCSSIHPLAIGSPFFASLDLERWGLEWIHPDLPLAHPLDDGAAATLDASLAVTTEDLGEDGDAWRRLLQPSVEHFDELAKDILGPLRIPRHPLLLARFGLDALHSVEGLARRRFRGPRAAALFAGLGAHSNLPLNRPLSAAVGLVLASAGHAVGWPFPRGGAGALTHALLECFRHHGGRVLTGAEVRTVDALPSATAVVLDLSPRQIVQIAGHRLPRRYVRALSRYRYGPGAFKVDWALSEPVPWEAQACRRAGTLHVGGTLAEIAASEAAAWQGRVNERPFVLAAQHSLFDPTRATEGRHTLWGYCHVPQGSETDMTSRVESQIERFAPGFRDIILARHTLSTADFERYNPNCVGGDITGGVADARQMLFRPARPWDPYSTPNDTLFICSASTPPGAGVHGMCGYFAARSVLRKHGA
jgi:phytoene dehydrogenase-like protein